MSTIQPISYLKEQATLMGRAMDALKSLPRNIAGEIVMETAALGATRSGTCILASDNAYMTAVVRT